MQACVYGPSTAAMARHPLTALLAIAAAEREDEARLEAMLARMVRARATKALLAEELVVLCDAAGGRRLVWRRWADQIGRAEVREGREALRECVEAGPTPTRKDRRG